MKKKMTRAEEEALYMGPQCFVVLWRIGGTGDYTSSLEAWEPRDVFMTQEEAEASIKEAEEIVRLFPDLLEDMTAEYRISKASFHKGRN